MVVLNDEFLLKHALPEEHREFTEKCEKIAKKTHIMMNNKNLNEIGEAVLCRNCKHLYLQDNQIVFITPVRQFRRLTHLYLQNNKIVHMHGFDTLTFLEKLYLGCNEICVLENLENSTSLEELHMETQRLKATEKLVCDPRSIQAISETLLVLDLAGNNITSIRRLEQLEKLEVLDISSNNLTDPNEVASSIDKLISLHTLTCENNPMCSKRNYKGIIIMAMHSIKLFNNSNVTQGMYSYYKSLDDFKKRTSPPGVKVESPEEGSASEGSDQGKEEDKNLVSMSDIKKILHELPSGLREAVSNPADYTSHIDVINKRAGLKK